MRYPRVSNELPGNAFVRFEHHLFQIKTGVVQDECSGELVVPTYGGLVKGQAYYARVFAYSPVGFSPGQVAPDPAKPTTVPGRPTSVSVDVYDAQSLKVVFSPPADDGGDTGKRDDVRRLLTTYSIFTNSAADNDSNALKCSV